MKPPWRRLGVWVQMGAGALVGGGLALLAIDSIRKYAPLEAALIVVSLPVAFWIQLVAHEAGHALAGFTAGLRPVALGVGPIRLERGERGWRWRFARSLQGIGGFAMLLPKSGEASSLQSAVYLLGGPMANLLLATAAMSLALAPDSGPTLVTALAAVFATAGVFLGVINLVPFVVGGWSTDGRQLLKLAQGSDEAKATAFLGRLTGLAMLGVRPRDWPLELPKSIDLGELPQGIADALARCHLAKALDDGRLDDAAAQQAAAQLVARFWSGQDGIRQLTALLLARWALESLEDLDLAEQWCDLSEGALLDIGAQRLATRSWIALGRDQTVASLELLNAAKSSKHTLLDQASRLTLEDDLSRLEARHRVIDSQKRGNLP